MGMTFDPHPVVLAIRAGAQKRRHQHNRTRSLDEVQDRHNPKLKTNENLKRPNEYNSCNHHTTAISDDDSNNSDSNDSEGSESDSDDDDKHLSLDTGSLLPLHFSFHEACQHHPAPSLKRPRALSDIDGEHSCGCKKKRRLRLILITSRLSLPFSAPATNIADKGSCKVAVLAKQHPLARNVLRKVALLNSVRKAVAQAIAVVATAAATAGAVGPTCRRRPPALDPRRTELELARLLGMYRLCDPSPARKDVRFANNLDAWPTAAARAAVAAITNSGGFGGRGGGAVVAAAAATTTTGPQTVSSTASPLSRSPLVQPTLESGVEIIGEIDEEEEDEDYRVSVNWDDDDDDEENDGVYSDWSAFEAPADSATDDSGDNEDELYTDAFTNIMPELVIRSQTRQSVVVTQG